MRSLNALRALVLAVGAAYLIFSQDHSVVVGMIAFQVVTLSFTLGTLILKRIPRFKLSMKEVAAPVAISFIVSLAAIYLSTNAELVQFKALVITFVIAMAANEFVLSTKAEQGEKIELRISASLGILTGILFIFAPLNDLNSVGFFSAYLALSAVQRAVWAAGPSNRKKTTNA